MEHTHWPATWRATGTQERPIWTCACGQTVSLDRATGRFEPAVGVAIEHSIQDPFTDEITVRIAL